MRSYTDKTFTVAIINWLASEAIFCFVSISLESEALPFLYELFIRKPPMTFQVECGFF